MCRSSSRRVRMGVRQRVLVVMMTHGSLHVRVRMRVVLESAYAHRTVCVKEWIARRRWLGGAVRGAKTGMVLLAGPWRGIVQACRGRVLCEFVRNAWRLLCVVHLIGCALAGALNMMLEVEAARPRYDGREPRRCQDRCIKRTWIYGLTAERAKITTRNSAVQMSL